MKKSSKKLGYVKNMLYLCIRIKIIRYMTQKETLINALLDELETEVPTQRYTHYFDNEICGESVQELIDKLHGCPAFDLYISTPGGELPAMNVLIHFLNSCPDVKIYLTGYVASAGTFLLLDCIHEVIITEDLQFLLFHMIDQVRENSFRKRAVDFNILIQQIEEENKKLAEKYKDLGLTPKEIKSYFEGNDVVLYRKDFERLKLK